MSFKTRFQKWFRKHFRPSKNPVQTFIAAQNIPAGWLVYTVGDRAFGVNPTTLIKNGRQGGKV